jgi:hypothetical protein
VNLPIVFRTEARAEFDEAFDWYEARRAGLGSAFSKEIQIVLDAIAEKPTVYPFAIADIRSTPNEILPSGRPGVEGNRMESAVVQS